MGAHSLDVDWREVRSAVEQGITLEKVANVFGINLNSIKARSKREHWLTSKKIRDATLEAEREAREQAGLKPESNLTPKTAGFVAKSLLEKQQIHRSLVERIAHKLLKGAEKGVNDGTLTIENISDLEKTVKVARLNLDLSSGEATAAVQILFTGQDAPVLREVSHLESESEGEYVGELE